MTAVAMNVSFDVGYIESLNALEGIEQKRINQSISLFLKDRNHTSLKFEELTGKHQRRLYTIRGSLELRILMAREKDVFVILHAGHHDDVYDLAKRKRFIVGKDANHIGLFDVGGADAPVDGKPGSRLAAPVDERPGVLDHWTDTELVELGFSGEQAASLRLLKDPDNLLGRLPDLSDELLDLFFEAIEKTPAQLKEPELIDEPNLLKDAIIRFGGAGGLSRLMSPEEVEELAARPIEAWMVFLHPDQRQLVEKSFSGPARVRGSAGTGKTVVALHRANHLAALNRAAGQTKPILFTTFIKSLTPVFERLFLRLPGADAGAVEFVHIDKVARDVCNRAGDRVSTIPKSIDQAFAKAHKQVVVSGTPLATAGFTRDYLRDEITQVIKGRGIRSVDEYLEIERTGRRAPMGKEQRRQVWELRECWDDEMDIRGTIDFCDVIVRARDHARRLPAPHYSSVIVDESQDLTLCGLQLARALVNGPDGDQPNGLFFVGDGAQRVYPGGYTLKQAGIEVRGRTSVLRTNYRNTEEIIGAAMAVGGDEDVDDLGDEFKRGEAPAEAQRVGFKPLAIACDDLDQQMDEIAERVLGIIEQDQISSGDIGVLVSSNRLAKQVTQRLKKIGVSTQELEGYDGRSNDMVKVGTYFRAKGLEFKVVFLPALGVETFPPKPSANESLAETAERRTLDLSRLFVAMTRARDGLVVLYSGAPSDAIEPHLHWFQAEARGQ